MSEDTFLRVLQNDLPSAAAAMEDAVRALKANRDHDLIMRARERATRVFARTVDDDVRWLVDNAVELTVVALELMDRLASTEKTHLMERRRVSLLEDALLYGPDYEHTGANSARVAAYKREFPGFYGEA